MSEQVGTGQNTKKGTEDQTSVPQTKEKPTSRKYPKTHQDYWRQRLRKRTFKKAGGKVQEVPDWQVRINYAGKEAWFNLKTANQAVASVKARDIYLSIVADGWAATIEKYKDTPDKKATKQPTVGDLIEEIARTSTLRPQTLAEYARKFRSIVGDIAGIERTAKRFDPYSGGRERWLERVNAVELHRITPKTIQQWKLRYLRQRGDNPVEERKARTTLNTIIRCAKSLFSKKILKFVELELPDTLPFDGIEFERVGRTRYKSEIDPVQLTADAFDELKDQHPEQFKIFLLALGVGLRRKEIDTLTWSQLEPERGIIRVETHEYVSLKTESSEEEVDVDPFVLNTLLEFQPDATGDFVLNSDVPLRPGVTYNHYRAGKDFKALVGWLREKGITANKPIHALRKEFGSLICEQAGIFAASAQLRHSNIQITQGYYLDKKAKVTVRMGEMLGRNSEPTSSDSSSTA